jgi:hypothetical protein
MSSSTQTTATIEHHYANAATGTQIASGRALRAEGHTTPSPALERMGDPLAALGEGFI